MLQGMTISIEIPESYARQTNDTYVNDCHEEDRLKDHNDSLRR
jgi:hypothetical protein